MVGVIQMVLGFAIIIPVVFLFNAKMTVRERMMYAPFVTGWCLLVVLAIAGLHALSDPLTRYMMFYSH